METSFKRMEYCFLAESTLIESATFLQTTALSKVNVKTNRKGITKWTYKERVFATRYFIILKI